MPQPLILLGNLHLVSYEEKKSERTQAGSSHKIYHEVLTQLGIFPCFLA